MLLSRQNLANRLNGNQDPTGSIQADRIAQTQADVARSPPSLAARRAAALTDRTLARATGGSTVAAKPNADISRSTCATATRPRDAARERLRDAVHDLPAPLDTAAIQAAREEVEPRIADLGTAGRALREPRRAGAAAADDGGAADLERVVIDGGASSPTQVQPRPLRNADPRPACSALVLGIGLAFLREALDTRVRIARGDRRAARRLPLLARIPEPRRSCAPRTSS